MGLENTKIDVYIFITDNVRYTFFFVVTREVKG